jgi:hypothetical protein
MGAEHGATLTHFMHHTEGDEGFFACDVHAHLYQPKNFLWIEKLVWPLDAMTKLPVGEAVPAEKPENFKYLCQCGVYWLDGKEYTYGESTKRPTPKTLRDFIDIHGKTEISKINQATGEVTKLDSPAIEKYKAAYKAYDFSPVLKMKEDRPKITARTQKARGLQALESYLNMSNIGTLGFGLHDAKTCKPSKLIDKFVRPCPMRPRHGFVDSRVIRNADEAAEIIRQTLEADAEAELVTMERIEAEYSGIWTTGHLAIGTGTDGATAGTSALTIPVIGDMSNSKLNKEAGINNAPYMELLWKSETHCGAPTDFQSYAVQLRDGPELPQSSQDYIPAEIIVSNVILAEGDLLEWETKMKNVPPGTIVHHPNGSLASHYAIHAVLNNIPVCITWAPKIGETVRPTTQGETKPSIELMRAGFVIGCKMEIPYNEAAYFMLAGCHHISQWRGKHDILLGAAMGCAWRLTIAAGLGESRHAKGARNSRRISRESIYDKAWAKVEALPVRKKFSKAIDAFLDADLWREGFGGKSWFKFVRFGVLMYNSLVDKNPDGALEFLNQLVHSEHNNGWAFNKFIMGSELDKVAECPVYGAVRCAPHIYRVLNATADTIKRAGMTYRRRAKLLLPKFVEEPTALKVTKAQVCIKDGGPEFGGLKVKVFHVQYKTGLGTSEYKTWKNQPVTWSYKTLERAESAMKDDPHTDELPSFRKGSETKYHKLSKKQAGYYTGGYSTDYVCLMPKEVMPETEAAPRSKKRVAKRVAKPETVRDAVLSCGKSLKGVVCLTKHLVKNAMMNPTPKGYMHTCEVGHNWDVCGQTTPKFKTLCLECADKAGWTPRHPIQTAQEIAVWGDL